jgi:hypothetical protein
VSALSDSWQLSKRSFAVVEQDKELLLFPLIAGISSVGWIALTVPLWLALEDLGEGPQQTALEYVLAFVLYLGLCFFGTFSSFCITYTTKIRFGGGDASFGESLRFALARLRPILLWSVARATVGLLLNLVDRIARSFGTVGQLVLSIVERVLDGLWEIVTAFVVPAMVYEGMGPVAAFKTSAGLFKQTWGKSLVKEIGFAWVEGLCLFGVCVLAMGLGFLLPVDLIPVLIGAAMVACILIVLSFEVASAVYDTALYVYATEQRVVGFEERQLFGALRPRP